MEEALEMTKYQHNSGLFVACKWFLHFKTKSLLKRELLHTDCPSFLFFFVRCILLPSDTIKAKSPAHSVLMAFNCKHVLNSC